MRTIFNCFLTALVLLLVVGVPVAAQVQAKVDVVAVPDRFKAGNGNEPTHGIPNVGVGARIVLKPAVNYGPSFGDYHASKLAVSTATWTFTSKPTGSVLTNADIKDTATASTSGLVVYFKPDVAGLYTVSMTATTDSGAGTATLGVTAANFKGVGAFRSATKTYSPFNCAPCHDQNSAPFSTFKNTNHASAHQRKLDTDGGHFGASCMNCHTASTQAGGNNGSYKNYATALAFVVPHNGAGVWDSLMTVADDSAAAGNDSLRTMMGLMGIQCESCHGPAGEHIKTGDPSLMAKEHSSAVCAPCHYSSDRHPKGYSWEFSLHAVSTANGASPNYMNRPGCTQCHTGQGFVNETIKGNPTPTGGYANEQGIGCVTCHDPHSNQGMESQLYRKTVADACTGCHTTRLSSRGLHHSHQGSLIKGVESTPMSSALNLATVGDYSGWQLPGYRYENSFHSEITERCVKCHMAPSPDFDPTYASPDTLLNKLGGHTWKIKYDPGTPLDASDDIINNRGCTGAECHGGTTADVKTFVEGSQTSLKVLLDTLKANLPKRPATASPNPNDPKFPTEAGLTTIQAAASYNYWFVLNDGSFGVHNPGYARQLLLSSIEQVKLGAGAAQVASIKDIPGDQGRRVQVVWNKFPAEDFAYNGVINYGVWRQDLQIGTKVTPMKNYTEMIASGVVGQKYSVSGLVWTYVAQVPATKLGMYAYVAETIKDIVGTDTVAAKSAFYIAGYSADNKVVYSSQPFSGFSVDNIVPLKVAQFSVTVDPTGAVLNWKPVDQDDVVEFLVYRGTTKDFTPATPIATVKGLTYTDASVTSGQAFWYIVQGVDKTGNKGDISSPSGTTTVESTDGVPTEYALGQNYPNPFNPTTVIPISLPNNGHVVLKVYTISGEEIATLIDREMSAGNYNFTWNGRNNAGMTVATGMYLYRLQSDKFSSVKKMVLVK